MCLFERLFDALRQTAPQNRRATDAHDPRHAHLPFVEASFSNFIEGTELELDEAVGLVYAAQHVPAQAADSHDPLGTIGAWPTHRNDDAGDPRGGLPLDVALPARDDDGWAPGLAAGPFQGRREPRRGIGVRAAGVGPWHRESGLGPPRQAGHDSGAGTRHGADG